MRRRDHRECRREARIDLYRGDIRARFEEREGERAEAGPHLEYVVARPHPRKARDLADDPRVNDEVLTPVLGWAQVEGFGQASDVSRPEQRGHQYQWGERSDHLPHAPQGVP